MRVFVSAVRCMPLLCVFRALNLQELIGNILHLRNAPYAITQMQYPSADMRPKDGQFLNYSIRDEAATINRKVLGEQHASQKGKVL